MGLLPSPYSSLTSTHEQKHPSFVNLLLSREDFDLSPSDYSSDIDTVKDLSRVWRKMGISEEEGAKRTVLLCDDEGDAVLQPYSHLPIPPFIPSLTSLSTDSSLLRTISALKLLSHETNVAAFLRASGLEKAEKEGKVDEERGRRVCREADAKVAKEFDQEWWMRVAETCGALEEAGGRSGVRHTKDEDTAARLVLRSEVGTQRRLIA